jgi:RNA polymerase sigma factor (sigma-70 family)
MSTPAITEAYKQYKSNPNVDTYEQFGRELLHFIKASLINKYKRNYDKIEDAVGEACIKVIDKLDTFKGLPEKFPSWVMTITFNQAGMIGRRQIVEGAVEFEDRDGISETHGSIDAKLDIQKVMATLSKEDQQIVEAKMRGESDRDIADSMWLTIPAVKNRWERIREEFRTQLGGDNAKG